MKKKKWVKIPRSQLDINIIVVTKGFILMYIKKTYKMTNCIEIEKCYTARYNIKGMKHNKKSKPTPEAMAKYNKKKATDELRRIILANFTGGWHLVLTYDKRKRPSVHEAEKRVKNFIRRIKYHLQKAGFDFKWVLVTEYEGKAIHHHLLIENVVGIIELVIKHWKFGFPNFTPVDEVDVQTLAEYLIKETDKTFRLDNGGRKQRYTHSRNLIIPQPKIETIFSNEFRKDPQTIKGYILVTDSILNGISEVTGYAYQSYRLIKLQKRRI